MRSFPFGIGYASGTYAGFPGNYQKTGYRSFKSGTQLTNSHLTLSNIEVEFVSSDTSSIKIKNEGAQPHSLVIYEVAFAFSDVVYAKSLLGVNFPFSMVDQGTNNNGEITGERREDCISCSWGLHTKDRRVLSL